MEGKRAQGGKEMRKHEMGVRLTQRQAILAKCYECANGYFDGKEDCAIPECPLHPLYAVPGERLKKYPSLLLEPLVFGGWR